MGELGNRMKEYEKDYRTRISRTQPVILRLDGKSFHTYTRGCEKPFDLKLMKAMDNTAIALCEEIQGAQLAFVQSDEVSILVHGYKRFTSSPWFNNYVQKMVSVSAGLASATFTIESMKVFGEIRKAIFDCRAFALPEWDVCNAFIWRQQDWTRNSVQMLARSMYSERQCFKKNNSQLQDMIHAKGKNWNDLPTSLKRGRCIVKESYEVTTPTGEASQRSRWVVDSEIPIFSENREYIEKYLEREV